MDRKKDRQTHTNRLLIHLTDKNSKTTKSTKFSMRLESEGLHVYGVHAAYIDLSSYDINIIFRLFSLSRMTSSRVSSRALNLAALAKT